MKGEAYGDFQRSPPPADRTVADAIGLPSGSGPQAVVVMGLYLSPPFLALRDIMFT